MPKVKIQGESERLSGIYYEFDPSSQPLGEGGMGKVFKGLRVDEQSGMTRAVAIKFMYSDLPDNVIERARREASIRLRNDNLVEMLGFIEIDKRDSLGNVARRYHVVSELLDGVMLDDLLNGCTVGKNGEEIPFAQQLVNERNTDPYRFAVRVIRSILSGLMALHDAGYIHRDIDPTNIMVTRDGHIKLIDFGIAKQLETLTTQDKSLTTAGQFLGKAVYAAPELVLGDVRHQDRTTDIYAVGILFFQLITGHPPFEGATHEVLDKQLHSKMPLSLIKVSEVRKVIAKATNKKQEQRYASAAEMRVDIDRLSSLELAPVSSFDMTKVWPVAAVVAILLCVGLVFALWTGTDSEAEAYLESETGNELLGNKTFTLDEVQEMIAIPTQAEKGVHLLDSLSRSGNSRATFMLSQLYFVSKKNEEADAQTDYVIKARENAKVVPNNYTAHRLLEKAIDQDETNYEALYQIALDYIGGTSRTDAVERDVPKAETLLRKARLAAEDRGDQEFRQRIDSVISLYCNR